MLKLLGVKVGAEQAVTDDEVRHLLDQGLRAGSFEVVERLLVDNVFKLSDRRVGSIMTPRQDIVWLDPEDSLADLHKKLAEHNHARYPVAQGDLVGRVDVGGHAAPATVHFGARRDGEYINPMLLLAGVPRAVLLPCC